MAFTKIVAAGINTGSSYTFQDLNTVGVVTAATVQVGSATTVHTTGIDLGSGNITSHNINSTGIITATSFVGPVTGNVTGNVTGDLTGDVTGNSDTSSNLTGSPSITVTNITASGNVSIAGTLTYEDVTNIDSVGIITAQGDISIADKIVHTGDTNTALRFPSADTITAETSGSERLRITSDGNIGIGLTNPEDYYPQSDDLVVGTTSGNRGISVVSATTGTGSIVFADGVGNFENRRGQIVYDHSTDSLELFTDQTERLRIDSSGRLLKSGQASLTSTSLSHSIQVAAASDANAIAIIGRAADDIGELSFYEADKSTKLGELQYRQDHVNIRHRVGDIVFATGGTTERLRIASDGDLEYRYNDADTSTEVGATQVPHGFRILNQNNTLGRLGGITFSHGGGETANAGIFHETTNTANTSTVGIGDLTFWTKPTGASHIVERLRITSAGKIGVGVIPATAWHSAASSNVIQVGNSVLFDYSAAQFDVGHNYYYDGSNYKFTSTGYAERITFSKSDGSIRFWSLGTGSANATATVDNIITIQSNGRIGIGNNSPTHPLNISRNTNGNVGSIKISGNDGSGDGGAAIHLADNETVKWSIFTRRYSNSNTLYFSTGENDSALSKLSIGSDGTLATAYNNRFQQRGYFDTATSNHSSSNCPAMAGVLSYGFGYQEGFSTTGGSWTNPYPNLVLGYHTGLLLGGYFGYGGTRVYADQPSRTSTILMSVGNNGNGVSVTNSLSKGGGTFRIAHPHPSKKYTHDLQHSFIEGPQCDNLYRGRVDLVDGTASINIDIASNMTDGTFVLLNRDIQCFTSNETGWDPVKGSVSGNILTITSQNNSSTDTISWMVIGERQDDKIKSHEMEMTDSDGKLIVEPLTIEQSHM